MRKLIAVLLFSCLTAGAVEEGQVGYAGGTLQTISPGVIGHLNYTSVTDLTYQYPGGVLSIPYTKIQSYQYTQEVARHLGVAAAIAVGLVKKRQRRHFFRISYTDKGDVSQVVVFEVPKQMPGTLLAVLQARAPQGCKPIGVCARQY